MLLVEQYARSALRISDYIYVMANGRVAKEGKAADFADLSELEKSYLGSTEEVAP